MLMYTSQYHQDNQYKSMPVEKHFNYNFVLSL